MKHVMSMLPQEDVTWASNYCKICFRSDMHLSVSPHNPPTWSHSLKQPDMEEVQSEQYSPVL